MIRHHSTEHPPRPLFQLGCAAPSWARKRVAFAMAVAAAVASAVGFVQSARPPAPARAQAAPQGTVSRGCECVYNEQQGKLETYDLDVHLTPQDLGAQGDDLMWHYAAQAPNNPGPFVAAEISGEYAFSAGPSTGACMSETDILPFRYLLTPDGQITPVGGTPPWQTFFHTQPTAENLSESGAGACSTTGRTAGNAPQDANTPGCFAETLWQLRFKSVIQPGGGASGGAGNKYFRYVRVAGFNRWPIQGGDEYVVATKYNATQCPDPTSCSYTFNLEESLPVTKYYYDFVRKANSPEDSRCDSQLDVCLPLKFDLVSGSCPTPTPTDTPTPTPTPCVEPCSKLDYYLLRTGVLPSTTGHNDPLMWYPQAERKHVGLEYEATYVESCATNPMTRIFTLKVKPDGTLDLPPGVGPRDGPLMLEPTTPPATNPTQSKARASEFCAQDQKQAKTPIADASLYYGTSEQTLNIATVWVESDKTYRFSEIRTTLDAAAANLPDVALYDAEGKIDYWEWIDAASFTHLGRADINPATSGKVFRYRYDLQAGPTTKVLTASELGASAGQASCSGEHTQCFDVKYKAFELRPMTIDIDLKFATRNPMTQVGSRCSPPYELNMDHRQAEVSIGAAKKGDPNDPNGWVLDFVGSWGSSQWPCTVDPSSGIGCQAGDPVHVAKLVPHANGGIFCNPPEPPRFAGYFAYVWYEVFHEPAAGAALSDTTARIDLKASDDNLDFVFAGDGKFVPPVVACPAVLVTPCYDASTALEVSYFTEHDLTLWFKDPAQNPPAADPNEGPGELGCHRTNTHGELILPYAFDAQGNAWRPDPQHLPNTIAEAVNFVRDTSDPGVPVAGVVYLGSGVFHETVNLSNTFNGGVSGQPEEGNNNIWLVGKGRDMTTIQSDSIHQTIVTQGYMNGGIIGMTVANTNAAGFAIEGDANNNGRYCHLGIDAGGGGMMVLGSQNGWFEDIDVQPVTTSGRDGILLGNGADDNHLIDVDVAAASGHGIKLLEGSDRNHLYLNRVEDADGGGILVHGTHNHIGASGNGNYVADSLNGIEIAFHDNDVIGNTLEGNWAGINVLGATASSNNRLVNNVITCSGWTGVYLGPSTHDNVESGSIVQHGPPVYPIDWWLDAGQNPQPAPASVDPCNAP